MDEAKILKIKQAVKSNFQSSPAHYQSFEERYGFFQRLNGQLLSRMNLPPDADILDIGCGTGASCVQILSALPRSRVWGLDNSSAMLETARNNIGESERLTFVEGDAANLTEHFDFSFDAIIYSASIFLIPDYQQSLRQAKTLLKPSGSVGLSFMDGIYDSGNNNLFALADQEAKTGVSLRKAVNLTEFHGFFAETFSSGLSWNEDFLLAEELLREFFSIPAMSAGLFPGLPYEDRVARVSLLFDHMPGTSRLFRWMLMVGQKAE
jgi:cyclopropane-fatty-acyl-phospholipid synthase